MTPIHVAPAVWLGLHWRALRGEAVLAGMVVGSAVTFGLTFSDENVKLAAGDDMLKNGLSGAWVGFCVNVFVTVSAGLVMQLLDRRRRAGAARPPAVKDAAAGAAEEERSERGVEEMDDPRHLDIGPVHDRLLNPALMLVLFLFLLFTVPFYWGVAQNGQQRNKWVGDVSAWAFTSLLLSGEPCFLLLRRRASVGERGPAGGRALAGAHRAHRRRACVCVWGGWHLFGHLGGAGAQLRGVSDVSQHIGKRAKARCARCVRARRPHGMHRRDGLHGALGRLLAAAHAGAALVPERPPQRSEPRGIRRLGDGGRVQWRRPRQGAGRRLQAAGCLRSVSAVRRGAVLCLL